MCVYVCVYVCVCVQCAFKHVQCTRPVMLYFVQVVRASDIDLPHFPLIGLPQCGSRG